MKVLVAADIHGFLDGLVEVRGYLVENKVHTVVLLGDYSVGFTDLGRNRVDAQYAVEELKDNAKVLALPGNCDDPKLVDFFKSEGVNLHNQVVELDGVSFIGLGGSNPSPFATPMELSEEDIYTKLDVLLKKAASDKIVLLIHFPPKDTECDLIPNGEHVGSSSLRQIIEEHEPDLCVCSHIHECAGKSCKIGKTEVVNVGPLSKGNIVVIDTPDLSYSHEILQRL